MPNPRFLVSATVIRVVCESANHVGFLTATKILFIVAATGFLCQPLQAAEKSMTVQDAYPASLEPLANELRAQYDKGRPSTQLLLHLADVYLDMGDNLYADNSERLGAYQKGAEFAAQALAHDQQNADAHYLYAANLGHVAQLRGLIEAALSINEIMAHVKTAVSLDSSHAGALHMLGMMYDGLPWIMGGDSQRALDYLRLAVAADRNYSHARLNLAKQYLKRKDYNSARHELEAVLAMQFPRDNYAWARYHVPEAQKLLNALPQNEMSVGARF